MELLIMSLVVLMAIILIIKKYQPHTVLLVSGLVMVAFALLFNPEAAFLPKGINSTGSRVLDIFELVRGVMTLRVAEIGLIIMSAGGFAKYMDHIGAADVMVKIAVKPLIQLKSPYIVLGLAYIIGQIINIFVPSAAGLAMLLLVSMYPILVRLGVTPAAAAAVIATTSCLDLGPASGTANAAAGWIGIKPMEYFIIHQVPAAIATMIVIAVLHFFVQRYFDRKEQNVGEVVEQDLKELKQAPLIYAVLPVLPLVLLIVFSKFVIDNINMHVVTAMIISMLVSMLFELIRKRSFKTISKDLMIFFKGMGSMFGSIVSLIICAEIFATGFITMGGVDALINMGNHLGLPAFFIMLLMVLLITFTALLTGSGNASFFAFGKLAPDISARIGVDSAALLLPMQFTGGIARSFSPVAGVVIICAGAANLSPFDIVKRTAIPMIGAILSSCIFGWLF